MNCNESSRGKEERGKPTALTIWGWTEQPCVRENVPQAWAHRSPHGWLWGAFRPLPCEATFWLERSKGPGWGGLPGERRPCSRFPVSLAVQPFYQVVLPPSLFPVGCLVTKSPVALSRCEQDFTGVGLGSWNRPSLCSTWHFSAPPQGRSGRRGRARPPCPVGWHCPRLNLHART